MILSTIDLFAGVGGLTLGLQRARLNGVRLFESKLLVDVDKDAAHTLRMNEPGLKYLQADIKKLRAADILKESGLRKGELDVLVGGPPCQGFSAAGRRAIDDPKNELVKIFLELAIELQPRMILMENVPQARNWNDGQFWEEIEELLTSGKKSYDADCQVLSAMDFGVPQLRRRAVLVAFRGDLGLGGLTFPRTSGKPLSKAKHTIHEEDDLALIAATASDYVSVDQAIGDLPPLEAGQSASVYTREPFTPYQKARRGHCSFLFNHEARAHSKSFLDRKIKKIAPGKSNMTLPSRQRFERENDREDYFSQAYGRLARTQIAQTITTSFMNPGSGRFTHYRDHRAITVREAARLQSFDDSFVFYGDAVDQQRCVGNAVPPLMARGIGEHFGKHLLTAVGTPSTRPSRRKRR